uniref:VPS50 subunit of EARP/GARPII complex n=1 Tax=Sinocyclocheilus grahami TaxID=75366 RepID=A0A672M1J9_SINGR
MSPVESFRTPSKEELRELREQPTDPQAEQEIIDSIEEVYFSSDSFDMVQYELERLPPDLNLLELEEYRDKLKRQQAAVSKRVANLILEKQPSYVKELERVTSLQTNLQLAAVICTNARRQLRSAKEGFTEASLGLLANQRRRQLLTGLLKSLRTIKTLQRTDVRLSEMLEEEDYPGAIQLCLECQKAASTFKHYNCISELNSKLQDTLEQIEEQLDVALSKTCKHFDVSHYTKVHLAYKLLGKTQTAMDQLHMHFTQAIHNTVFQVVLGYVELCAGNADTKFQKMQYKDLCTVRPFSIHSPIPPVDGCPRKSDKAAGIDLVWQRATLTLIPISFFSETRLEELRMFLENETWELCPVKYNFSIAQLHEFKFMGQCRSPSVSPSRQPESIEPVELSLFEQYLQGGNPFEMQIDNKEEETEDVLASNGYESDELEKSVYQDYDSDSDVPEELKQDYVDEQTGDAPVKSVSRETLRSQKRSDYNLNRANAPILTNTTLNVIRLVGKYMQMMNILKPIAFDVIHCVSQLFDYYLYAVYTFFGRNDMYESSGLGLISSRLRTTLSRIQESLIDVVSKNKALVMHSFCFIFSLAISLLWFISSLGLSYVTITNPSGNGSVHLCEFPIASHQIQTKHERHDIDPYITICFLQEFENFNQRLGDVSKIVRIPLPVSNVLWEHCIRLANRTLVEGYANVKKCSNEGRALMQLDFQQFLMKLEKLTDLRPIPDKEFVETYIKAYYLTENDMEQFIKNHREYSMKQLTNLVNVCLGSHINKKARQKLLAAIDDIDRPKR